MICCHPTLPRFRPVIPLLTCLIAVTALLAGILSATPARADPSRIVAHVFWQAGCPHCANAKETLGMIAALAPDVAVEEIELGASPENDALFLKMVALLEMERPAVPVVVIGERHIIGHAGGGIARKQYTALIERCRNRGCVDLVGQVRLLSEAAAGRIKLDPATLRAEIGPTAEAPADGPTAEPGLPPSVRLPVFGEIVLTDLSLPLLTVVLAGIDGFNPCAMWVLVLLIGLLAGVADARRMWTLGLVFLAATGVMYFAPGQGFTTSANTGPTRRASARSPAPARASA